MGNCSSAEEIREKGGENGETAEVERRSRALDQELREYERRLASQIKILLLGAGESGKTTILKVRTLGSAAGAPDADSSHTLVTSK